MRSGLKLILRFTVPSNLKSSVRAAAFRFIILALLQELLIQ